MHAERRGSSKRSGAHASRVTPEALHAACLKVVEELMAHESAWPFNTPVDVVALNIPDYLEAIGNTPMDLGTVREKLQQGAYTYLHEAVEDIRQVWRNCFVYNPPRSEVYRMGKTLSKKWDSLYTKRLAKARLSTQELTGKGLLVAEEPPSSDEEEAPPVKVRKTEHVEEAVNDGICAVCEREGNVLCCDGPCLRSFHLICTGMLRIPDDAKWFCDDCAAGIHDCFHCKQPGVDMLEVLPCSHITCGRFYHPHCITAQRLATESNGTYTCPLHVCAACKKPDSVFHLLKCHRCPLAFHPACAPDLAESVRPGVFDDSIGQQRYPEPYSFQVNEAYMVCPKHNVKVKRNIPEMRLLQASTIDPPQRRLERLVPDLGPYLGRLLHIQ